MKELFQKGDFGPLYFPFESGPKSTFLGPKSPFTRDHNFRRENTVDQNRILGATLTRDLNSFKHFSGPKNRTLPTSLRI